MKTLAALEQLQKTNHSLLLLPVPSEATSTAIKTQLKILQEIPYVSILNFLTAENEARLCKIVSQLKTGTADFYEFVFLAYNLSKSETDFDLLTSSEKLPVYEKIVAVSESCGIALPPYTNVLKKIADNKQFGLYSENQEIAFFLEEYDRYKNTCDANEFLRGFKKILKYPTQCLFEHFIHDGIFSLIKSTLKEFASKIANEQTLVFYVYGLHYYESDISNEDEKFLLDHIQFCVNSLSSHDEITFSPPNKTRLIPKFEDDESALYYFFVHNKETVHSLDRFVALLKDICPSQETNDFCDFLRLNLHKNKPVSCNDTKNHFVKTITKVIREKAKSENIQLYKDICNLLPQWFICERSPHLFHHGGSTYYHFFDYYGVFLFYAAEHGNQNQRVPEAHVKIELEILEKDKNGYVTLWNWNDLNEDSLLELKSMTNQNIVEWFLKTNRHEYCDDCLSELCKVYPRQQVHQICSYRSSSIKRHDSGICFHCESKKITRSIKE